ncbi:helix-turn-helix transcriptional regulator [Leminorella grimontii]|uniref:XRE family transcriptional regulator n=1 Tax=Leminorella grimontii TaxID=82981 RepID=UPI00321FC848
MTNKPENELTAGIGTRIRIRREALGLSRQHVSDTVGVALSTLQAWENGEREPTASAIMKLAIALRAKANWLLTGEEESNQTYPVAEGSDSDLSEYVFVPRYDISAAAGNGAWNEDEKPVFTMAFRRYWIERYLQADPDQLSVISVQGDSMEGVLNDKDVILINHADTDPKEGIYVLRIDGHLFVKQVQRLPNAQLEISSTSPVYKPFTIELKKPPTDFAVIGKVVWYGRTL